MPLQASSITIRRAPEKTSVMRVRMESRRILVSQAESDAPDRMDQRGRVSLVDLATQVADIDVEHIVVAFEIVLPDMLQDHGAGHHLARMAQQVLQQRVLGG